MSRDCWRPAGDGVRVSVRLTPRGGRDAIGGIERDAEGRLWLTARVRAVPEDGAANEALTRLMAKALGVPRTAVDLVSGATSRRKEIHVAGEVAALAARLAALAGEAN